MTDWAFWAVAAAMLAGVGWVLVQTLRREHVAPAGNLRVYSEQLADVDRDIARGTIELAEAQRIKVEVSRRLLEADRLLERQPAVTAGVGWVPVAAVGVALAAAVAFYARVGAPGYPDLPLKARLAQSDALMRTRPSQAEAEAEAGPPAPAVAVDASFADLMTRLRAAVAARPGDLKGLELLARNEAGIGNLGAAAAAMAQVIALRGEAASAEDHASLAELRIRAAGGYVSPEAEADLVRALQKNPDNAVARYFSGLMFAQGGRQDRTFLIWRKLLEDSPPDAPWVPLIRAQLPDMARRAGVRYDLPPLKGPSAADVAGAAGQTPEARAAMIEGMVGQLSTRLAAQGGTVEEWAQLIRALGVLQRGDEAATTYAKATASFAGQDSSLSFLKEAAVEAGLTP